MVLEVVHAAVMDGGTMGRVLLGRAEVQMQIHDADMEEEGREKREGQTVQVDIASSRMSGRRGAFRSGR